jgi:divalent metal cation (Fe/Co/Zn/Cd) transporter
LGDFVTLFAWRLSQKPPSQKYPYGFGKFETLGTISISILLTGGALGIGFHSYNLLMDALTPTMSTLPPGIIQDVFQAAQNLPVPELGHAHAHAASGLDAEGHAPVLDPNAAWFAAIGVLSKEWLYRITKKVADEERSSVLLANAIHHRSDAYSSMVALVAILGNWYFPALPLDPIGGTGPVSCFGTASADMDVPFQSPRLTRVFGYPQTGNHALRRRVR